MDKPKFNFLDALILIVIILVIAAGLYFLKGADTASVGEAQTTTAEFKIQLTKADMSLYEKFAAAKESGESVWIGVKERFEGKVSDVVVEPAKKITTDTHLGKAVVGEDPSSYDITVTVKAAAVESSSAISASGTAIRVGEEHAIRGKGFAGYGFVIDLKTVAE
jgi:hypothetical protein